MLLRPLFFTSFLIDDQLAEQGLTERGPILISSASSKTAIAAAFLLAQREGVELIGLTSARSAEFVEGLGIYARTVAYEEIESLEPGARHLRRHRRRRWGAPRGPRPFRQRAPPQYGGRRHPLGGVREPPGASCPGRRRPSSSPPIGSSSAPRIGGAPASSSGSPRPGTPSASGSRTGWRRSRRGLRGLRAPVSRCSRAGSTRVGRTSSRWSTSRAPGSRLRRGDVDNFGAAPTQLVNAPLGRDDKEAKMKFMLLGLPMAESKRKWRR